MLVKDVMTKAVVAVSPEATLKEAGDILKRRRISGLPVLDGDTMVGILTITDVMRFILDNIYQVKVVEQSMPDLRIIDMIKKEKLETEVSKIMSRKIDTLSEDDTIDDVMRLMFVKNIHTLPVLKDGKIVGVVGRRDLVEVL